MSGFRSFLMIQMRRALWWRHSHRRHAFRACFLGEDGKPTLDGEVVLADLKRFCKLTDSSFVPGDPYATALNEGRREVMNRILAHLYLSDDTIAAIVEQTYPTDAGGMDDEN